MTNHPSVFCLMRFLQRFVAGWWAFMGSLLLALAAGADVPSSHNLKSASEPAPELAGVGIDEKLGQPLDLSWRFRTDAGEEFSLGQILADGKPLLLSLVYYNCPGLCSLHLNGVLDGLNLLEWPIGDRFKYLTLSFDSREGVDLASKKKSNYLENYNKSSELTNRSWLFATADEETVKALTEVVGFKYRWEHSTQEWAHASALIFISPKGVVTRYLHGVSFDPEQLKLAIAEAAQGTIGNTLEKLVWYCYRYDPAQSRYVIYAFRLVQIGGGLTVILLALLLIPTWRRQT
jgi:protein SCO1/2